MKTAVINYGMSGTGDLTSLGVSGSTQLGFPAANLDLSNIPNLNLRYSSFTILSPGGTLNVNIHQSGSPATYPPAGATVVGFGIDHEGNPIPDGQKVCYVRAKLSPEALARGSGAENLILQFSYVGVTSTHTMRIVGPDVSVAFVRPNGLGGVSHMSNNFSEGAGELIISGDDPSNPFWYDYGGEPLVDVEIIYGYALITS